MRKLTQLAASIIFALILATVSCVSASAQSQPFPLHTYYASDYGQWSFQLQAPSQYTFSPNNFCVGNVPGSASQFFLFNTNAPILIIDANASLNEVVTPSSVILTGAQCGVTVAPANVHNTAKLVSGTAGLQEAINNLGVTALAYPAIIHLDRVWYTLAAAVPSTTPAAIIAAAKGNTKAVLVDDTTVPSTAYFWNATLNKYQNIGPAAGGITAPTVALGTGAGTAPTNLVISGNGSYGVVTFLAGASPTASATIFTLTFPTAANGSFSYIPSCTITSIGGISYTTGTVASVYTPPAVTTFTASGTALTASTQYSFKYNCQ